MTSIEPSYRSVLPRLVVLCLALFVVGANGLVIAGILPELSTAFGTSSAVTGLAITWYSLSVATLSPIVSIALARVPRAPLAAAGLALFAGGAVITAVANGFPMFVLGRVVAAFGGAALVPTAIAAAAAIAPPARRGTALAIVSGGFTLATVLGAPAGTALAAIASWRAPLAAIGLAAALLALLVVLLLRDVPNPPPVPFAARLRPLRRPRVLAALAATLLVVAAFNAVYIFSSAETAAVTGGRPGVLAVLLLIYGVAALAGNLAVGPLIDRVGAVRAGVVAMAVNVVAIAAVPFVAGSFGLLSVTFVVWGIGSGAAATPIQHRLVDLDPGQASVVLSWNSTALYLGIALAPIVGGAALASGGGAVAAAAAAIGALALIAFIAGAAHASRTPRPSVATDARGA